jgi:hypothetical protein
MRIDRANLEYAIKMALVWGVAMWLMYQFSLFDRDYCKHHPDSDDCTQHGFAGQYYW